MLYNRFPWVGSIADVQIIHDNIQNDGKLINVNTIFYFDNNH